MPPTRPFRQPQWNQLPQFTWRWVMRAAFAIILLWGALTSFTSVPADSEGVLIRLGQYAGTVPPGLRLIAPFGIDRLVIIPVQRQLKLEFGFSTPGGSNPDQYPDDKEAERDMVTGDLNMATVEWVVQYRISDAKQFLFHVRDPGPTLRDASEAVLREVVGDRTVDEVLTIGRQDIESESLALLQKLAGLYGLGVNVIQVQLKNIHPPEPVQASFNEVNQAQQEKQQVINLAYAEYNRAVPFARGQADQRITEAEGYALRRVNEARGDADRFQAVYAAYRKAPEVTRTRLHLETLAEVLPQFERKVLTGEQTGQVLPLLQLGTGAALPAAPPQPPGQPQRPRRTQPE